MKRVRRNLGIALSWVAALLLPVGLYFLAAWVGARIPVHADFTPQPGGQRVYIVSNGLHVDVVVPIVTPEMDWSAWLPVDELGVGRGGWLAFGWGDRGFYLNTPTWDDLTLETAVNAVLWPSPSAMHITHYSFPPRPRERVYVHVVDISRQQFARLIVYLRSGFRTDTDGRPIPIDHPGYSWNDLFFEGESRYHLMRTCNHWTNGALKAAGIPTSLWAPFEGGVRRYLP